MFRGGASQQMASHHTRLERGSFRQAIRIALCIAIAGLVLAADGPAARAQSDYASIPTHSGSSASSSKPAADGRVKLNMQGASWHKALKRIARHAGIELVMKASPPGTFTCTDPTEHTVSDALRLVNRQLEPMGFRAIQQGNFLLLLNLDGLRSGYNSPSVVRFPRPDNAAAEASPAPAAPGSTPRPSGAVQVSGTAPETSAAPPVMELNPDGSVAGSTPAVAAAPKASDPAGASTASTAADSSHTSGDAEKDPKEPKTPEEEKIDKADTTPTIRVWFLSATWPQVLASVCEQSGLTLVAKKGPSGTVKFRDLKRYTTGEIISILNQELDGDQSNFRLVRQDKFLLIINKDDLRSEYQRPVVGNLRHPVHSEVEMITESRPATSVAPSLPPSAPVATGVVPAEASFPASATPEPQRASAIEPVRLEKADDAPELFPAPSASESAASKPESAPAALTHGPALLPRAEEIASPAPLPSPAQAVLSDSGTAYVPQRRRVEALARKVYSALKTRSELVDAGPENLPAFRVFESAGARSRVTCTVGIDTEHNRLVIDAPARKRSALRHLLDCMDESEPTVDDNLRLISADVPRATLAKNVTTELNRLIAQNAPTPPVPSPDEAPGRATIQVAPGQQQNLSELIKGLKGEVTVESVPDLGILILRGNPADVEAVMKVIREVERLSRGQAPQIQILNLKYVNSESFARLMSSVYQDLHGLRTSEAAAAKVQIKFYAIVKPNAVLVIAPPAEMGGVRELAAQLDKPVVPDTEFQVFPLKHGVASSVAKSVNDFYKGRTGLGTVVEAVADARTNSVIVQARPRDLEEVAKLITRLDGPTAATATLKVFTLTNGDAATIVRLLESLFTTGQRQGAAAQVPTTETGETPPTSLRLSADVRTNSIIAVGAPDTLRAVEAVIYRLDNTDAHQRQTVVIKLKNNSSDAVAKAVNDFVTSERSVAQIDPDLVSTVELLEREVFIVSEPVSNALLLSATPRYFEQLKKMIDKLDEPPRQVVIQAMIVEVTLTNDDEFGIELGFQSPVLFDRSTLSPPVTLQVTTSQNTNTTVANNVALSTTAAPGFQFTDPNLGVDGLGTNSIVNTSQVGTQELTNFGVGRTSSVNPAYGSGLVLAASSESVSFLLRALSYKDTVHVLSRPMIRTVDNQQASVQVGKNVPIIYGFTTTAAGSLAPIVRYDGAGIILQVWPRITPDGMIVMETGIEKSVYESGGVVLVTDATTGRTISSPVKDVTRAQATVSLASGETVVLGGLITNQDETTERKVPWVGDVPILGQLFRYDTKTTIRSELLIFLTPRVIRNDADDEILKQIETERLHFLLDEAESIHGPILSTQPQGDGLLQQVPPLTMPSQVPGEVPPAPGVVPPMAPPATMQRGPQPTTPPELPPVLPPGVSPAPGVAPPVPMLPPRAGVSPPVPHEAYLDDPNVPTTQMPSSSAQVQVRPLGNPNLGPTTKPGDAAGTVRFAPQAAEADPNAGQSAGIGR
jgi:type II secretion system protein D